MRFRVQVTPLVDDVYNDAAQFGPNYDIRVTSNIISVKVTRADIGISPCMTDTLTLPSAVLGCAYPPVAPCTFCGVVSCVVWF